MSIAWLQEDRRWRTSLVAAGISHFLFILFLLFGPVLNFTPVNSRQEVRLVRLAGGGQNRPGWVKPTTAAADNAKIADARPKKVKPKPKPKEKAPEQVAPAETPAELRAEPEQAKVSDEPAERPSQAQPAMVPETEETGEGVGAKPGPEGPGFGAQSDGDFPGAEAYLSRVEAEVQRRFNYRGTKSGSSAEYHFFIDKSGKMRELLLVRSSGIPSMDMAARSALTRAKYPPLPGGFRADKLGVTYIFYDAD